LHPASIMTKAIIFDLDCCLAAADEVGQHFFAPAFAAIRAANDGSVPEDALQAAFSECWRVAFDAVANKHGFTPAMRAAGWQAFRHAEVTIPMYGYGDLAVVKDLPVQRFLVTSGFRRLQESKVRALGFADWFAAIYIDAIDESDRRGKQGIFQDLLTTHRLRPNQVLVVGDNPDSEIAAGNRLGMKTVQVLRPGVPRSERASHHIQGLTELKGLL
jgi:putative hydrolase of the HAD superfamily